MAVWSRDLRGAADEIEDLRFQLRGMQGELDGALSRERTLRDEQDDARIGADNLQEEIERLRAELRTYTGDGHTLGEHLAREAT